MIEKIIRHLQTGSVKNVTYRTGAVAMDPPYIVADIQGQELRVWVHFLPGQNVALERYWRLDLPKLLNNYEFETAEGNTVVIRPPPGVYTIQPYSAIVINDKTISRERRWSVPGLVF